MDMNDRRACIRRFDTCGGNLDGRYREIGMFTIKRGIPGYCAGHNDFAVSYHLILLR